MSLFTRSKATVTRLFRKLGASDIVATVKSGRSFVVADGSVSAGTPTTYDLYGVATRYRQDELKDNLIQDTDLKLIIDTSSGYIPDVDDSITLRDVEYRVMKVSPIMVQDGDVGYQLQLRV